MVGPGIRCHHWFVSMSEGQFQPDFETIWAEIKLLLEWQQGFGFYLVFCDDLRVSRQLRQRVEDATRLRTQPLQWLRPEEPEVALGQIIKAVLPEDSASVFHDWHAPVWVELTVGPGQAVWEGVRRSVLSTLNRLRSALEAGCPRPLFLQLPEAMLPEVVTWAPDLWSIRQYVALLPSHSLDTSWDMPIDNPVIYREMTLEQAFAAEKKHLDGDLSTALEGYRLTVERFEQLRASLGDTPQVLRDLSVSLIKLGDAESAMDNPEGARLAYREGLKLAEQLRASLGDTPQVLRDLSVSLNKLGDAESEMGNPEGARLAYREGLKLAEQLRASLGDTPQVLRDLSVSLNKLGDAESEMGNPEGARLAYREGLKLAEQLRASLGDTPQVLRDLSVSLSKLGDAESAMGNPEGALSAYRESLKYTQQLRARLGDTPQVLKQIAYILGCIFTLMERLGLSIDVAEQEELLAINELLKNHRELA